MIRSLYLHIPFCRSRCSYCNFYSQTDLSIRTEYLRALEAEALSYASGALTIMPDTVYIGGGTPSVLAQSDFIYIFRNVTGLFNLSANCEITVEANPRDIRTGMLKTLHRMGVNRLSIGFQFLNGRLLADSGRKHSRRRAIESFKTARTEGFENINIDIMYGFPTQTMQELRHTLQHVADLKPEHISAYLYTPPPLTGTANEDDSLGLDMYNEVCSALNANGYDHYEISNFSKKIPHSTVKRRKTYRSKHNLNYWNGGDYVGFGAGAFTTIGSSRFKNNEIHSYINDPLHREEEILTAEIKRFEKRFLSLRATGGIPYRKKHDIFIDRGYLRKQGNKTYFTETGWFLSNSIITEIL